MKERNMMEIDVFHLKSFGNRKLLIALVAFVTGIVAFAYSSFIVKRVYEIYDWVCGPIVIRR